MKEVSVLMTVFNGAEYLKDSINSILHQTYEDFDFIIVDDKSTDESLDLINSVQDSRITIVKNEKNIGQTKSLNKGIAFCNSKYILRMDADDISKFNRLEIQLNRVNEDKLQLLGSGVNLISSDGKFIKIYKGEMGIHKRPSRNIEIIWYSLFESPISGGTFLFEKSFLSKLGGYNERIRFCQDYHLASLFSYHYQAGNVKDELLDVRVHQNSSTNSNPEWIRAESKDISKENILRNFPQIHKSKFFKSIDKIRSTPSYDRFLIITELIKQFINKYPEAIFNSYITEHASVEIIRCLQNIQNKKELIEKYVNPLHENLAISTINKF